MPRPKGSKNKKTIEREQTQMGLASASAREDMPDSDFPPLLEEPIPVVTEQSDFVEYASPSGDRWRIERGRELCRVFEVEPSGLTRWHVAMAPEERTWRIVRLHFGVSPLLGEKNLEYLRPQSLEEIAQGMSVTVGDIEGELQSARAFWARWVISQASQAPYTPPSLQRRSEEDKQQLLNQYNFDDLTREGDKIYAIQRIGDLQGQLDDDEGRPIAIQAIRMELQMAMFDRLITKSGEKVEGNIGSRDELQSYLRTQQGIRENYLKVMEALEATQAQSSSLQKRVQFVDSLGSLVQAVQEYEATGDRALIDGMHTAAEIELLITPLTVRPPQYRPDLVALVHDALKSHNLWNPDYEPPQFARGVYRRLMKGFNEGLQSAAEADGVVGVFPDSENEDSSEEGDDEAVAAPSAPITPTQVAVPPSIQSSGDQEVYSSK